MNRLDYNLRTLSTLLLAMLAWTLATGPTEAQVIHPLPRKKLIEFGWDMPSPAFLRDNIRTMEKRPFDGVAIRLPDDAGGGCVFDVVKWSKASPDARERELRILADIPPGATFTDNFITVYGASTMDWFREADWKRVLENVRFCARAAKAGHCKGICWDAEPYTGHNPWRYIEQPDYKKHTFAETYQMARKRGKQFMRALQDEFPGITVFALRLLSDFQDGSPFSQHILPVHNGKQATADMEGTWWALHPAFINGLLDAAMPGTTLIDGNEDAYFYASPLDFYRAAHVMHHEAQALVAPENRRKYVTQYQAGHALSMDYTQGLWAEALSFPDYLKKQALELTPGQRLQWLEHNTFYALTTADEYVWFYTEHMNWWMGTTIPAGIEEALRSARRKYEAGEPLGFTVEPLLQEAQQRLKDREKVK